MELKSLSYPDSGRHSQVLVDDSGKLLAYSEETTTGVIRCMIDFSGDYWAEFKLKDDPAMFHFVCNKRYMDTALHSIGEMDNDFVYTPVGDCPHKL
jgi:hypothetical protein